MIGAGRMFVAECLANRKDYILFAKLLNCGTYSTIQTQKDCFALSELLSYIHEAKMHDMVMVMDIPS